MLTERGRRSHQRLSTLDRKLRRKPRTAQQGDEIDRFGRGLLPPTESISRAIPVQVR